RWPAPGTSTVRRARAHAGCGRRRRERSSAPSRRSGGCARAQPGEASRAGPCRGAPPGWARAGPGAERWARRGAGLAAAGRRGMGDAARAALRGLLPPFAAVGNPVDLTPQVEPARILAAVRRVFDEPAIAGVVAVNVGLDIPEFADGVVAAARGSGKPAVAFT